MDKRAKTLLLGARFSKCSLTNIGDMDWQHIDQIKIFERVSRLDKESLRRDLLFYSRLVTSTAISFAILYPELCVEVTKNYD